MSAEGDTEMGGDLKNPPGGAAGEPEYEEIREQVCIRHRTS